MIKNIITNVINEREEKVTYRRRAFLNLIKWWEVKNIETIADDIYIIAEHPIRDIYFNGELLKKGI